MTLMCLLSVLFFLHSIYGLELSVQPNQKSVILPPPNDLPTRTSLSCRVRVTPPIFLQWVVQSIESPAPQYIGRGRYKNGYSMELIGDEMFLFIENLSYERSGNYTCFVQPTSDVLASFELATIPLSLRVKLETSPAIIVAGNETATLEMRCEMSQYIEPESNLRWFKEGLEIVSDGEKYNISFENGDSLAVRNGRVLASRVSVLVVLNFQPENDTGCYYCRTLGGSSLPVSVSTDRPDPLSCKEQPKISISSAVVLPSTTPTPPGTSTDPANPGETEGDEEDGTLSQGVPLFATVITASCVGLVLLFSAVLLVMICCLRCHRHKLNNEGNASGAYMDGSVAEWSGFSPPLPPGPRPNLHRVSQNSEYYMNEGEDPDTPYQSIPPYLSMASFSAHSHLQLPSVGNHYQNYATGHMYDTVSDEVKTSEVATPDDEYVLVPGGPLGKQEGVDNEYVKMSSNNGEESENNNYVNSLDEIEDSDSAENTSNNEYVPIPTTTTRESTLHPSYVNIQIVEDDDSSTGKMPEVDTSDLTSVYTYDKLSRQ